MTKHQSIYGLIGKKLSHSFSQKYFRDKFDSQAVIADYLNFELSKISQVSGVLETENLRGLNVTIPYKEEVIPFLDEISTEASQIGAVNTIQFKDGRTIGHNTDAFGFRQMIAPFFKPRHERVMILGTGGASKAVAWSLEQLGCNVIYVSRNPSGGDQFSYEEVNEMMVSINKFIVNTTPLGMYPHTGECPHIPYEFITEDHLVVDLIYNPSQTLFLKKAASRGAVTLNGQTMLEQQAEKAWQIWNE